MCRGRHRVEIRVVEVQARGGAVRCGVGRGGGAMVQILLLSPGNSVCICPVRAVTKSRARHHFTALLFKLHARKESALDDLPIRQICTVKGSRCVRVESWNNDEVAHQQLPGTIT